MTVPAPQQVYDTGHGPAIYVRTEKRPGDEEPRHLFIHVEGRIVMEVWSDGVPEGYTLIHDPEATERALAIAHRLVTAIREREALVKVLKEAIPLVPVVTANHLRAAYREAMAS